ncbi:MAG: membrane protein insertion efficiency factor YidD [Planctomycetota bacterium]|jgi:putative membrane protein insertion efficiency factor
MMRGWLRRIVIAPIRVYQWGIAPLLPQGLCRYEPTCSHYTVTAIERKGVIKGLIMGAWRILRCNPFARGGWDPVDPTDRPTYLKVESAPTEGGACSPGHKTGE